MTENNERPATATTHEPAADPREAMDATCELLAAAAPLSQLATQMNRLVGTLREKFEADEKNGTFEEAAFALPCLTGPLETVLHQRKTLMMTLLELNRRLHDGPPPHECRESLSRDFSSFVEQYLEHEATVHQLLQEAYSEPGWE